MQQEREVFQQQIEQVDPKRLFFFDETGFNLGMTRLYGRAPSSERAYGKVPVNTGKTGVRAFCGDARGIICYTVGGNEPDVVDGECQVGPGCTPLR